MTEQEAIAKTIEMWTKLAETGEEKPELEGVVNNCYLCEEFRDDTCNRCPYYKKYGPCLKEGNPYKTWRDIDKTPADKRIHAADFLAQVKILQEPNMKVIDGFETGDGMVVTFDEGFLEFSCQHVALENIHKFILGLRCMEATLAKK